MELSQEKKTQIAGCHGKGMTLSEISARCGLVEGVVAEFLESIGKTPNKSERRKYRRVTDEQKEQMQKLADEGRSVYTIAKEMDIDIKTVQKHLKNANKEKEPASAATDTSSVGCIKKTDGDTVSLSKDTTDAAKSQALSPFTALTLLEALLDNWVGNEYDKYFMQAYEGVAEFIFTYKGRKYAFKFKECKGDDEK